MSIVFRCPDCNGQLISMEHEPVPCKCDAPDLKYPPGYAPAAEAPPTEEPPAEEAPATEEPAAEEPESEAPSEPPQPVRRSRAKEKD